MKISKKVAVNTDVTNKPGISDTTNINDIITVLSILNFLLDIKNKNNRIANIKSDIVIRPSAV